MQLIYHLTFGIIIMKKETMIKIKENSIRRTMEKIATLKLQIVGLEEFRMFCNENRYVALENRCPIIIFNSGKYKNFDYWPNSVGGHKKREGYSNSAVIMDYYYYADYNKTVAVVNKKAIVIIDDYYHEMIDNLKAALEKEEKKLSRLYEEYGRLIYEFKTE